MKINKDLSDLVHAGVIDQETADKIAEYYETKAGPPQNKLLIVFGILGALLIGMGILLILAHNWDDLSRTLKTILAFIPLFLGQAICGFTLLKKEDSTTWREAGSAFLVFAVGSCVALIGQIYNIPGNLESFLLTWIILTLPVVYVMRSSVASLLYLIGVTFYGCQTGYWESHGHESYTYWGLLLLVLPYYYWLYKTKSESNFFTFHNWFIPLSVVICLGTIATDHADYMFVAYMSLLGLLYLIGHTPVLESQKVRNNGYLVLGSLGTVSLLMALSFNWFWDDFRNEDYTTDPSLLSPEIIASILLTMAALALLVYLKSRQKPIRINPIEPVFILFIGIFLLGRTAPWVTALINVMVLAIGIMTIREGARQNHFGILNYGLLIVTVLITCRFFDTNLSFVLRGLLFIGVGLGFFYANYRMANKKKEKEAKEA